MAGKESKKALIVSIPLGLMAVVLLMVLFLSFRDPSNLLRIDESRPGEQNRAGNNPAYQDSGEVNFRDRDGGQENRTAGPNGGKKDGWINLIGKAVFRSTGAPAPGADVRFFSAYHDIFLLETELGTLKAVQEEAGYDIHGKSIRKLESSIDFLRGKENLDEGKEGIEKAVEWLEKGDPFLKGNAGKDGGFKVRITFGTQYKTRRSRDGNLQIGSNVPGQLLIVCSIRVKGEFYEGNKLVKLPVKGGPLKVSIAIDDTIDPVYSSITGKVLDEDGYIMEGALVKVTNNEYIYQNDKRVFGGWEFITNKEGAFQIEKIPPSKRVYVKIEKKGYRILVDRFPVPVQPVYREFRLEKSRPVPVEGRLRDEKGAPVADCTIMIYMEFWTGNQGWTPCYILKTDENGKFRREFEYVSPVVTLLTFRDGFAHRRIEFKKEENRFLEIELKPGGAGIAGQVVDKEGNPCVARVRLFVPKKGYLPWIMTNEEGRFRFGGMGVAEEYVVDVDHPDSRLMGFFRSKVVNTPDSGVIMVLEKDKDIEEMERFEQGLEDKEKEENEDD
jgi:hypothetical protein